MSTVKTDSVIGTFLPIPVIEHATDFEVYTATAGQTVFTTTKFDRSNAIRAIAKSSGGAFSEVTASWTGANTVTISGTILGAGQIFYIFKVGTHASKIRVQDPSGAWVDLSSYAAAKAGANSDITSLTGLTTALSIAQGGTGGNTPDAARSALGVTGRNRIINGACAIAQRPSLVAATGASTYGGPDRFLASNTGAAGGQFTQSQGTIVDGGVTKLSIVQTVNTAIASTTGANYWGGLLQLIEGYNCFDLVGSPVAVSFIFKTNVTGNFSVALRDSAGAVSYNTSFAAVSGVPVKVAINIPAVPANATVPQNSGVGMQLWIGAINTGTYQAPAGGAWSTANYMTVPSATNWGATIGNYISLTDLQFEAGTATPFERRSHQQELALCQRYYYRMGANVPVAMGHFRASTTVASFTWRHPVTMRASPSFATSSGAAFNIYCSSGAPLSASSTVIGASIDTIWLNVNGATANIDTPTMLVVTNSSWLECAVEL